MIGSRVLLLLTAALLVASVPTGGALDARASASAETVVLEVSSEEAHVAAPDLAAGREPSGRAAAEQTARPFPVSTPPVPPPEA